MKPTDIIASTLKEILNFLDINPKLDILVDSSGEESSLIVNIEGRNLNYLIGYRGESLLGLQHYLGLVLFQKTGEWTRVTVDINGYKDTRQEKLEDIARRAIDKVRFFRETVEMRPMSSFERRMIHMFVSEYDDVTTISIGEGPSRRIVVKPSDLEDSAVFESIE